MGMNPGYGPLKGKTTRDGLVSPLLPERQQGGGGRFLPGFIWAWPIYIYIYI